MFCSKCGTDLPDDSQFCRKCGQALANTPTGGREVSAPVGPKPRRSIAIWFLAPLLLLVVCWAIWQMNEHGAYGTGTPSHQSMPFFRQLHRVTIGTGALTVPASNFTYYKLPVPLGATDVRVQGRFSATGGAGNDIEVYLLNQDSFTNWQNGHTAGTFYNSGKVTVGELSATLPNDAGTYYLVFDNRFSLLSPKAVQESMSLTYYSH